MPKRTARTVRPKKTSVREKLNTLLVVVFFLLVALTLFTWAFMSSIIVSFSGTPLAILNFFGTISIVIIALYYVTRFLKRSS